MNTLTPKTAAYAFLKTCGMHPERIDVESCLEAFLDEMKKGLNGEDSSLAMIPTYVAPTEQIEVGKKVIVIDAGGTNLRTALISFDVSIDGSARPVVESFQKTKMPGTQGELTKEEFYNRFADFILSLTDDADEIGFCFSYPAEILPNGDGRVMNFTKEVKAREVEGTVIGECLREALKKKGVDKDIGVVVLNDTVTTLLTAQADLLERKYGSYVGFILGTGSNTCYVEKNANIGKLDGLNEGIQIINCETGNFCRIPLGRADEMLDKASSAPGKCYLEKQISGAYMGELVFHTLFLAMEAGLVPALDINESLDTKDVNDFMIIPESTENALGAALADKSDDARETVYWIIDGLLERAARLSAVNMAAAIIKTGEGTNPMRPVSVGIDGTSYAGRYFYRERIEYYLYDMLRVKRGIYYDLLKTDNASLIGAAVAALGKC